MVTLLSNGFLLSFLIHRLCTKAKQLNVVLGTAVVYIALTILAALYNLLYRWTVPSPEWCEVIDIIKEVNISVTRSVLLLFYQQILSKVFADLNKWLLRGALTFIVVVHMVALPAFYISQQEHVGWNTIHYGVYCRDECRTKMAKSAAILYQCVDFALTASFCAVFVVKLRSHIAKLHKEQQHSQVMEQVLQLAKRATKLCLVSAFSSWLIVFGGRVDTQSVTFLRWIQPLDYVVNAWCVVLFFDWGEAMQCLAQCFDADTVKSDADKR